MSNAQFDFLAHSILFDDNFINGLDNSKETENKILKELEEYFNYCIKSYYKFEEEINTASPNGIRTFFNSRSRIEIIETKYLVTQSLLRDLCIVPDPLFRFCISLQNNHINQAHASHLGMSKSNPLDSIRSICRYLKGCTLYVAKRYLKFYPEITSIKPKGIPITYSPNGFSDFFEKNLLQWIHQSAKVYPMEKSEKGLIIKKNKALIPCRSIFVEFEEDIESGTFYNLFDQKLISYNEEERTGSFEMYLPNTPPSKEAFDHWVNQSINQTANHYVNDIRSNIFWANTFNSTVSTSSDFVRRLLSNLYPTNEESKPIHGLGAIELHYKFPDNVEIETIFNMRDDQQLFVAFRNFLYEKQRELSQVSSDDSTKLTQAINDELKRKYIPEFTNKLSSIKTNEALKWISIASAIGVGSLELNGAMTGVLALGLSAGGLKGTKDNLDTLKSMPGYFWSKITNN